MVAGIDSCVLGPWPVSRPPRIFGSRSSNWSNDAMRAAWPARCPPSPSACELAIVSLPGKPRQAQAMHPVILCLLIGRETTQDQP